MSLNDTPSGERVHIGIFGKRNAGKSSLINALTGQKLSIVSNIKGTTTDPVYKAMELLPIGPVMMIDTPGTDDEGELGAERIKAAKRVLCKTDFALVAAEGGRLSEEDDRLIEIIKARKIPYIIVYTKSDLTADIKINAENEIAVSAESGQNINELRELIALRFKTDDGGKRLAADLIRPGGIAVLVIPVDSAAPKGRLILPQQQVIRDILEAGGFSFVTKETGVKEAIASLENKPEIVITDSQAFERVSKDVPPDIKLTSFSILMARYKGTLEQSVKGAASIETLKDGDTVLISEGCTHHRQCEDIGTVKLPGWIEGYTGKRLDFRFTSGREFPEDLSGVSLAVHCGGCMLSAKEMRYRLELAGQQGVPMTNYGILIAYIHGILQRSIEIFPDICI